MNIWKKVVNRVREIVRLIIRPSQKEKRASLTTRFGRAAILSVGGTVASRLVALAVGILMARRLQVSGFGEFNFIQNSLGLAMTLCGLSMGSTATRYVALLRDTDSKRCTRIIALGESSVVVLGLLGSIALWLAAEPLSSAFPHQHGIDRLFRYAAPSIPFGLLNGLQTGVLIGLERFILLAWLQPVGGLITGGASIVGAYTGNLPGAVQGWVWGVVASWLLTAVAMRAALRRHSITIGAQSYRSCLREQAVLWQYSFPATLQSIISMGSAWAAQALILRTGEKGASEWGIYTVAQQWRWAALYIPLVLSNLSLPFLANLYGRGEVRRMRNFARYQISMNAGFGALAMVAILILSPWIVALYGKGYENARACIMILAASIVFATSNSVIRQQLLGLGRTWTLVGLSISYWAMIFAFLLWGFHMAWSPSVAYATAVSISEAGLTALMFIFWKKRIGVDRIADQSIPSSMPSPDAPTVSTME